MVVCGFIFDVIVVRVDAPNNQLEDANLLAVDCVFNNVSLKITSSRINVVDFRSGRSYEFDSDPEDLKSDLANNPLHLVLKYNEEIIGKHNG